MAKVWVKAISIVHISEHGTRKTYYPGDWFKIGKHQARVLESQANIEIPKLSTLHDVQDLYDCGVVLYGSKIKQCTEQLKQRYQGLEVNTGKIELEYPRTLLWDGAAKLRVDLIGTGFTQLNHGWQIAVPLLDLETLAQDIGTEEEREQTKKMIFDLRVPVYDPRIMFVRRCQDMIDLITLYVKGEGNKQLGFLRALQQMKPKILALPPTWRR